MKIGLGLGLYGLRSGWAGPVAPVITSPGSIDAQPLVGQVVSIVEPSVTDASSVAYQWYSGPPPTTPIGGWASAIPTPTDTQYAFDLWRRATYTNATGDTVEDLQAPGVVGKTYSDTFSGKSPGDVWTQFDTLYDRTATQIDPLAITDAAAPSGKSVTIKPATSAVRAIWLGAAATFGAAQAAKTTRTQGVFVWRHTGTNGGRYLLRYVSSTLAWITPGVTVYQGKVRLQINTEAEDQDIGTLLGTMAVGDVGCLRLEQEGVTIKAKFWIYGDPEPTSWTSRTCTLSYTPPAPAFGTRYASSFPAPQYDLWYWSGGYNADAPFWNGYVPPPPDFSDAMVYAAPSSGTTASYFSGEIIFTMEDI